jgi:hypothetical protein
MKSEWTEIWEKFVAGPSDLHQMKIPQWKQIDKKKPSEIVSR